KPRGHEKVAGKQQSRTTVVKRDRSLVVPRRRDHIDGSITEVDFSQAVRPIRELVVTPNAIDIKSDHLSIRKMLELRITGAMIKVPMGMNDKQGKFCRSLSRKH